MHQDHAQTRLAATSGVEQSAAAAMKAAKLAVELREARQKEKQEQRDTTFNQKVNGLWGGAARPGVSCSVCVRAP